MTTFQPPRSARSSSGFTLIEVLVSLIILSVGLLGLGLLQAQSLKASYSSNHRTIATNLAYELLDEMRANRRLSYRFSYISPSDFASISASSCDPSPMPTGDTDVVGHDISGWECQVVKNLPLNTALGDGATITFGGTNPAGVAQAGVVTIQLKWTDQRFQNAADQNNVFTLSSEL